LYVFIYVKNKNKKQLGNKISLN